MSFAYRYEPPATPGNDTVLVLHGTGGDEHSLVPFAQTLAPAAGILSPRGRILERGMPRFFRRFGEGIFDYENLREEADALADFVRERSAAEPFDPHRVVAIGYSNGANMALATLFRHPETWQTGLLFRPMVTLTSPGTDPQTELEHAPNLQGKRIFLAFGRQDPIVPIANAEALIEQLREFGASVEVAWHPGGHELTRPEIESAREFVGWA